MIKLALISIVGAGVVGTGAHTLTPQTLEIAAGSVVFELGADGLEIDAAIRPDFAVTLTTKGDRAFTVRL